MDLETQPQARQILETLAKKVKLGLVTDTNTSFEPSVRTALQRLGIESFFSAIVTSQDVGVEKPSPEIFQEALRRLGVAASDAVMVGNDLDRDIAGARRLGMPTILFTSSRYFDPDRAHFADYRIDSLAQIPAVLEDIQQREEHRTLDCETPKTSVPRESPTEHPKRGR
jgi:putative hydrolase of the HAD superfamily